MFVNLYFELLLFMIKKIELMGPRRRRPQLSPLKEFCIKILNYFNNKCDAYKSGNDYFRNLRLLN